MSMRTDDSTAGKALTESAENAEKTGKTEKTERTEAAENAEATGAVSAEATAAAEPGDGRDANTVSYADQINAQYDALDRQTEASADAATARSISEARSEAAAEQAALRDQYRDATAQQYQAMDRQILSDQSSGRYGGVAGAGLSAAAQRYQSQRNELSSEQLALAASTAQQVEQLRAQGEFDKADALLQNTQQRLRMLYEDAVRVNEAIASNAQYEQQLALTEQQTEAQRQDSELSRLQEQGWLLLQYGVVPPENMLTAMGLDAATAKTLAKRGLRATVR